MKLSLLWGYMKRAWEYLRPLILSQVGRFLADPEVRKLALESVERVAKMDLDGDGKHDHAVACLAAQLDRIRLRYRRAWLGLVVEAAYQHARRKP